MPFSALSLLPRRSIVKVVPATVPGAGSPIQRLIGTVDIDGKGTLHPLAECDPCMLLDYGRIVKHNMPPFGAHPHRGHSVVTILLQGTVQSWDSVTNHHKSITGPSSYWVNAGTGLFHDETSIINDESDPHQHVALFQLWLGVQETDRQQPPSLGWATDLPQQALLDDDKGKTIIGSIVYFVGGNDPSTESIASILPRPLTVAKITQFPHTKHCWKIPAGHTGFVVNLSSGGGGATFAGTAQPTAVNDVLVISPPPPTDTDTDNGSVLEIDTHDAPAEYLLCVGEPHQEPWVKKLVASGAVIAQTEDQARTVAAQVEGLSKQGKETGDFSPFGTTPPSPN